MLAVNRGKEKHTGSFVFLFTVRFWVLAWLIILFVGLTPVPPVIELLILAAFLAHFSSFAHLPIRLALTRTAAPATTGRTRANPSKRGQ